MSHWGNIIKLVAVSTTAYIVSQMANDIGVDNSRTSHSLSGHPKLIFIFFVFAVH